MRAIALRMRPASMFRSLRTTPPAPWEVVAGLTTGILVFVALHATQVFVVSSVYGAPFVGPSIFSVYGANNSRVELTDLGYWMWRVQHGMFVLISIIIACVVVRSARMPPMPEVRFVLSTAIFAAGALLLLIIARGGGADVVSLVHEAFIMPWVDHR